MTRMTLEQMLATVEDSVLLDVYKELESCVVPATGYAHELCRKINKLIDRGDLCVRPGTYRRVYLPTLSKAVFSEMAARYANYLRNNKAPAQDVRKVFESRCHLCGREFDGDDLFMTDIGPVCGPCLRTIERRNNE